MPLLVDCLIMPDLAAKCLPLVAAVVLVAFLASLGGLESDLRVSAVLSVLVTFLAIL